MKKNFTIFLTLSFLVLFLVACNGDSQEGNASGDPITLSFANELPAEHPWGKGAEEFKKIVEEETGGEIKVEIHNGGSLGGSGAEIQEGASVGTIDIGISSTPMAQINPPIEIFSLPYMFSDNEHAWKVLDGPIGQNIGENLKEDNLKHLAYWEDGFRQVTNSVRPIKSPEDFEGLSIRVPESEVRIDTFEALGASPLPMSFSEVFTALQQGTIDGQENPLPVVENSSFYDVQKYLTLTNHVYSPATLFINLDKWENLTKDQQDVIMKAAKAGRDLNRNLNQEQKDKLITGLKEKGMEVQEIENIEKFQEATSSVWDQLIKDLGGDSEEIINKIQEAQ